MDKNETLERRFSLNMTNLPNPIAESTCVNLNGSTARNGIGGMRSAAGEFRWGGSPISPKNRSNSALCLNNKNRSTATSPQRARMNLSKIDPRIYADVQSRGLVSRIVQYHESGSRLNRSMSTSNIYSKSGQPSIAQLQRTDLPYRATQQNVAMTRIVQPKKSVFYGNTLSSLLRSNSVISVQKSDEELSCENQPILHPPPTENDLAPTRSVLDVLKEISRKRINSDDSDAIRDANKKYCNRDCNDAPQYETPLTPADPRNMGMHGLNTATMYTPMQSYKRQREHIAIPQQQQQQQQQQQPLHCTQNLNGLTNITAHTQHSPEQIAKKRLCSYNNDITSSLSSSLIHANKRKFYEQQQRSTIQHSPPSMIEEYESQKTKIQRQQTDLRFQQLTKSLSCNTPITPLPETPLNATLNVPILAGHIETPRDILPESTAATVKRTVSEPPILHDQFSSKPLKPKLTLFNRNYNEPTDSNRIKDKDEELEENSKAVDNGECADIQFVKPKKSSAIVNKKNPLIERTQKSKLAMMLSGLRGEIYQGETGDDEVDKIYSKQINNPASSEKTGGDVTASVNTAITSTKTNFIMKTPDKLNTAQSTETPAAPNTSTNAPASSKATTATTATTLPTALTATTSASTFANFKLTSPQSTTSSGSPATTTVTAAKTTSPLVGIKLTPQKPVLDSVGDGNAGTVAPIFNIGATPTATPADTTKAVAGTIATGVGKVPQLQGFSFGLTTKSTTTSNTATSTPTLTSTVATTVAATTIVTTAANNVGGFKFDSTATRAATTTVAAATFGSFANTIASTTTTVTTEAAAKPIFAFGAATNSTGATTTASAAPKPTFNFGGTAASTAATTTATPVFGAIGAGTLTFGGANNSTTTTATNAAPSTAPQSLSNPFGSGAAAGNAFAAVPSSTTKSSSTFAFGAASTTTVTTTTNAISSGTTPASETTNIFSFGGSQSAVAAPTTATAATTSNVTPFAFGGAGANNQQALPAATTTTANMNTNKPIFSFGGSGSNAAANTLGGATNVGTSSGNLFAFGGKSTSSESSLFGNNTASTNTAQPNASATAPTSSQPNAFTFGAVAAQGSAPAFGSGNNTQQTSTSAFGAAKATTATPFAFGGNLNKSSTPAPANNVLTSGFSFGANTNAGAITGGNNTAASTTNIFGTAAASTLSNNPPAATPSNTNIVKPTFNFGGASTNSSNDANKSSIFGAVATDTSNNTTTFGGFGAPVAAANQSNKTFSFGSNAPTNNVAASNPFAAAANKPAVGGFAFNTSNATNNQPTAAASLNASTPFAFGGANNNAVPTSAAASTPFSFGNNSGSGGIAPANKTFTFGSSSNQNSSAAPATNASSIFGGGGGVQGTNTNNAQQNSVAPFSFSAGAAAAGGQPQAAANIFAPPAVPGVGGGTGDGRKIRRATRRLQKT